MLMMYKGPGYRATHFALHQSPELGIEPLTSLSSKVLSRINISHNRRETRASLKAPLPLYTPLSPSEELSQDKPSKRTVY